MTTTWDNGMTKDELIDAWIKDLRTTKEKQGKSKLHSNYGFCCLGRLCVVAGLEGKRHDGYMEWFVEYEGAKLYLPGRLADFLGMSDHGHYDTPFAGESEKEDDGRARTLSLANMNDRGETFARIAKAIEAKRDEIFTWEERQPKE